MNTILGHIGGENIPDPSQFDTIDVEQLRASITTSTGSVISKANGIPMLAALIDGNDNLVKMLLKNGTDPNQQMDENGKTALHYATEYSTDEYLFRLLLEHDANVNASTRDTKFTPLHLAAQFNKVKFWSHSE